MGDFTQEYLPGSWFDESEQGYCVVKRHIVTLHRHNRKNKRKKRYKKRVSCKANTKSGRRKNLWIQGETLKLKKFLNHSVLNCAAKINIVSHFRKRLYKPARKYANNSDRKFRKFCPISRKTSRSFTALNMWYRAYRMFVQNPLRKVPGRIREDNIYEYVGVRETDAWRR